VFVLSCFLNAFKFEAGPLLLIPDLDETWFDTHEVLMKGWVDDSGKWQLNVPPARGKRVIILHAGNEDGWVNNCLNISQSSANYHKDMDSELFEKWFSNSLIPNLPLRSVIVIILFATTI
jgi:hypothetical protein